MTGQIWGAKLPEAIVQERPVSAPSKWSELGHMLTFLTYPYPTKTIFPTCRLAKNASCAATIPTSGKVAATTGLISPRSM